MAGDHPGHARDHLLCSNSRTSTNQYPATALLDRSEQMMGSQFLHSGGGARVLG
jgi:hypothetical protein